MNLPDPGPVDGLAYGEGSPGFNVLMGNTNGGADAAYGAIVGTDGSLFEGAGDLSGLKITTTQTSSIIYGGADVSLATAVSPDDGHGSFSLYGGPSYRYLSQKNRTVTDVNVPAVTNPGTSDLVMPTYSDIKDENLTSNYFGGLAGVNYSAPVSDSLTWNIGGKVGVYSVWSTFDGTSSASITGGHLTTNPPPVGGGALPLATNTVTTGTASGSSTGIAYTGGLSSSISMALSQNTAVTLGGSVDYLSNVPTVVHATATASSGATPSIGSAGMFTYALTGTLAGHF
jgi:hypothetical protein